MRFLRVVGGLRNKIFLAMMLVGVLPVIITGVLVYYTLTTAHRTDVAVIEENFLRQKTEEIQRFLNDVLASFALIITVDAKDIERSFGLPQQRFILGQYFQTLPSLEALSFLDAAGRETIRYSRVYRDGQRGESGEESIFELEDLSRLQPFARAGRGEPSLGEVHFTLRGPMLTAASPVKSRDDAIIGVLIGEINLSELRGVAERSVLGNEGYLYLTDQDGLLIAHSQPDKLTPVALTSGFLGKLLKGESFLGVEKQSRYLSFWGDSVVAAGDYLPNVGWAIVAEWPVREADKLIRDQITLTAVISLLVLMGTVVLSIFLAGQIVRPIKLLEAGTQRVAHGKFEEPVAIETDDEIEELGNAFNKMMRGLKQLEELKEEFVFIAAHELRTPVTAIKGYLSMIVDGDAGPVSDPIKSFLEKVIAANQRLVQLVNDLLTVARTEAGRLTIEVKPTAITEPVWAVLEELKPLADEKSIKLTYQPLEALPDVLGDAARIKEILVNLVGNAIKYTLGSGTVTVAHEVKEGWLTTQVKDTGVGISKEAQQKLFEKFYRVQTEKTRDITGTGLGLFIVKQIVEKMGGKIWAESPTFVERTSAGKEEGKGSTFSFSLPLASGS